MSTPFLYPPTAQILQWLGAGQLASRLQRTVRLWVLLQRLYGPDHPWTIDLPQPFTYPQIRDRLFAAGHPTADTLSAAQIAQSCPDRRCICHYTLKELLSQHLEQQSLAEWQQTIGQLTGLSVTDLTQQLQTYPFATVHRTLRDDLKQLGQLGWLEIPNQGRYQCRPAYQWPHPPLEQKLTLGFDQLSEVQTWQLMRVLESIAFIQPNLDVLVQTLWEQATRHPSHQNRRRPEPTQRIFIHLDYIFSDETQDRVDAYQEELEELWQTPSGGVVRFQCLVPHQNRQMEVTVYPVCLHYVRRAKYLSAYGQDPGGAITWHNYRMDRIISPRLTLLPWGDPSIPQELQQLRHTGQLPTPEFIQQKLEEAWGFNFYLPRRLLLMRFPEEFARWYVDDTLRHGTLQPVAAQQLPALVRQEIADPTEQEMVLEIIRHPTAADPNIKPKVKPKVKYIYYRAWIREGDINVIMRLRDWRPNGEVIAPISLRQQMATEARQELENYLRETI